MAATSGRQEAADGVNASARHAHLSYFSTDMLAERGRFAAFREEIALRTFRIDVRCEDEAAFRSSFQTARLGSVTVLNGRYSPASFGRTRELTQDGNDDFLFQISSASSFQAVQLGRAIQEGEGVLGDNSRVGRIHCATPGSITTVSLPRKTLMGFVPRAENLALVNTVGGEQLEMKLLRTYLTTLYETPEIDAARLLMAGSHIVDLLAMALGAGGEPAVGAANGGVRAARSLAVRRSVIARLRDPALSPADIAKANRISERYLRQIFEDIGMGFADFLVERRLEWAHDRLSDPARRGDRVSTIAFEAGFSDLSHFNRRFRKRYGLTPTDLRARI